MVAVQIGPSGEHRPAHPTQHGGLVKALLRPGGSDVIGGGPVALVTRIKRVAAGKPVGDNVPRPLPMRASRSGIYVEPAKRHVKSVIIDGVGVHELLG